MTRAAIDDGPFNLDKTACVSSWMESNLDSILKATTQKSWKSRSIDQLVNYSAASSDLQLGRARGTSPGRVLACPTSIDHDNGRKPCRQIVAVGNLHAPPIGGCRSVRTTLRGTL